MNNTEDNEPNSTDKTLFVFVDESGNLDFSPKGTKFYVLAAVATTNPIKSASLLQQLKYSHLQSGDDVEMFHASEDRQQIRNGVLSCIGDMGGMVAVHYVYAQKNKTHPTIQNGPAFYTKLGAALTKFIIGYRSEGYSKVVIIFDKCLRGKEQDAFLKEVKPKLKAFGKPYRIYFYRVLSDFNGQIADYCAWSKYVSLERNELRPMASLKEIQKSDFNLFARGTTEYY